MNKWFLPMRVGCLLGVLLLVGTVSAQAAVKSDEFDTANRAYAAQKYDDAIRLYENLLTANGVSSSVLYNLGNAYYAKGEIGKAVLEYQRALILEPNAQDIAMNLTAIRQEQHLPAPLDPWWLKPFLYFSLNQWTWLGLIALVVVMLAVFVHGVWLNWLTPATLPLTKIRVIIALGIVVLLLAGSGLYVQSKRLEQQVVMSPESLHVSPFSDAGTIASLQEGDLVYPLKRYNDYVYVKNPAGHKGWILANKLQPVMPPS